MSKGYIRGITSVSPTAARTASARPTTNGAQVFGRMAPSATMTNRMGRSRKCVKVGSRASARARSSYRIVDPVASATRVSRRSRMK